MAVSKAQQKCVNKYVAQNYDRVNLTMPAGKLDQVRKLAETVPSRLKDDGRMMSVNEYINMLLSDAITAAGMEPVLSKEEQKTRTAVPAQIPGEDAIF